MKNANFLGSVARIFARRSAIVWKASSHEIASNSARRRARPRLALQRLRQARRRVLFHDARRALGADHAFVDGVLGIAVDVADFAATQVHADAAAACAHVTGGGLDFGRLVEGFGGGSDTEIPVLRAKRRDSTRTRDIGSNQRGLSRQSENLVLHRRARSPQCRNVDLAGSPRTRRARGWRTAGARREDRHARSGSPPRRRRAQSAAARRRCPERELARARSLPELRVSSREKGDIIMLGIGGFTPLDGLHDARRLARRVRRVPHGRAASSGRFRSRSRPTTRRAPSASTSARDIALVDPDSDDILATMKVSEKYAIDKAHECLSVFRTTDAEHPGVKMVLAQGEINLAGPLKVLSDGGFKAKYGALYMTPAETRAEFERLGWSKVAAFQTRNPMHRSHEYLAKVAIEVCDGVLVHSLLGAVKPGDIPAEVRTAGDRRADRTVLRRRHRGAGRLPARHALRGPARSAAARGLPPELRLLASDRRTRSRGRRQLLRAVRRAPHLRRDSARLARNAAAQARRDVLVLPLRRHGVGPHVPAQRSGPACRCPARSCASGCRKAPKCRPEFSRPEVLEILREYYASIEDGEKIEGLAGSRSAATEDRAVRYA